MLSTSQAIPSADELSCKADALAGNSITNCCVNSGDLDPEIGLSSSSDTESASSGDTALTDPSAPLTILDPLKSTDGLYGVSNHAVVASDLTMPKRLMDTLPWSTRGRTLASSEPEVFNWFSPSEIPSPAAFHFWRREMCKQHMLNLSSEDEKAFYEHFIDTKYHPSIRKRIKDDQQRFERHLLRCQRKIKDNDDVQGGIFLANLTTAEHDEYERIDWIFNGVAEAVCRHSLPAPPVQQQSARGHSNEAPTPAEQTPRNKKGFPLVYFTERNSFHEQWIEYCRTQASNQQNILYDYAPFASHNPYSLYHKVKYGDHGSPHPYVPYAITNAKEWEKSCQDQARQEAEALAWLAQRRMQVGTTQQELDLIAQKLRGGPSDLPSLPRVPSTTSLGEVQIKSNGASTAVVPLGIADDVVVDHEIEQPQAMGVKEPATPLVSTEAANCANSQPGPAAATDTLNNTSISAATSISHPITVSVLIPEGLMPWLRSNIYKQLKVDHPEKLPYLCDDSRRQLLSPSVQSRRTTGNPSATGRGDDTKLSAKPAEASVFTVQSPPLIRLRPVMNMSAIVTDDEVPWRSGGKMLLQEAFQRHEAEASALHPSLAGAIAGPRWSSVGVEDSDEPPPSFRLGNMFLSSCPGKKVRLTGAVRGRGAVCRDLAIDLQRFRALGVGTLVCCLSDNELGVIGVKWEDYLSEADKLGLDLVRVPMVEGNCPTTQEYLDAWLEEIVLNCTLKGVNVLVHCRGGVGRAGTIAACWLVKMGLVDEFRAPDEVARRGEVVPDQEVLWQCLQVVRMRRSSKAIETAEQAAYIAKYAEYLIARWEEAHPGQECLSSEYRSLVSSYWERIRRETDQWVRQELHEASERKRGINGSSGGDAATSDATSIEIKGQHHANIRSKAAAKVPTLNAKGGEVNTNSSRVAIPSTAKSQTKVNGSSSSPVVHAAAFTIPQGPFPQRKTSLTALSTPIQVDVAAASSSDSSSGSNIGLSAGVDAESLPANDMGRNEDGEPSRKRRNTATLSVDDMRLSDTEESLGAKLAPVLAAAPGSGAGEAYADVEEDMDAFPVNGRRHEGCNGSASSGGAEDYIDAASGTPHHLHHVQHHHYPVPTPLLSSDEVL